MFQRISATALVALTWFAAVATIVAWIGALVAMVSMFWHLGGTFAEWLVFRVLELMQ